MNGRTIGVNFNRNGQADICVWAPNCDAVAINTGSVAVDLSKGQLGFWYGSSTEIKPGDTYKVLLNNQNEYPDPASLSQPEGVHGPSQAIVIDDFEWTDLGWKNLSLEEYILYELHTGTFSPEGTFKGIEARLDYLLQLGVNAIEIMPVAQFPGNRNWGYDGVYPFAVQNNYGGAKGLQQLVDACHQKGIAVILDVVYNHLGPEGNYLQNFGPYFTSKYNTPWGTAINFDDEYCDGVRQMFIENALMWFRDFHIDALRLDAVHAIKDFSPTHILQEIKIRTDELMQQTGRTHYLIVEMDLNDNRYINPLEQQGYGMDAQWVDEFHHALRVVAGEPSTGYYTDFTGIHQLAKSYKDAYVFDGQYSEHRKKIFGKKADDNPGKQFIVFSQNHDQVGNRMMGERSSRLVSLEMQKLMAGAVMVSPYLPMLFMGEEYAEPNPFLYFVNHSDKELVEAVRKGRKEEFAAFHLTGEAPDPFSIETFEESKLQWELLHSEPHATMLAYYQALIALRKEHIAMRDLNRKQVRTEVDEEKNILVLHRMHEEQDVVCIMNFSKQTQTTTLPISENGWVKLFDSADPKWNGPKEAVDSSEGNKELIVQPESITIYSNRTNIQNV